jgi:modification methylase
MLRPGGFVVVTARPWRRAGELVDLSAAVLACAEDAGLIPYERNVALLTGLRGDSLVPRVSFFQLEHVRKARAAGCRAPVFRSRSSKRQMQAGFERIATECL